MWLSCGILNVEAMAGLMVMGDHTRWRMTDQLGFFRINTLGQGLTLGWRVALLNKTGRKRWMFLDIGRVILGS